MTKIALVVVWFLHLGVCLGTLVVRCGGRPLFPPLCATGYLIFFTLYTLAIVYAFCHDQKRPAEGCCRSCEYDLRGNVSGICPEGGTPIPPEVKQEALHKELAEAVPADLGNQTPLNSCLDIGRGCAGGLAYGTLPGQYDAAKA